MRAFLSSLIVLMIVLASSAGSVAGPSSTNYAIPFSTLDSGTGPSSSSNYQLSTSVAQTATAGMSGSASYALRSGVLSPPDSDMDGVRDFMDNCIFVMNSPQQDTDADGYGNACDADFNQNGLVEIFDFLMLKAAIGTTSALYDLNENGLVEIFDFLILKSEIGQPPGPSALAP